MKKSIREQFADTMLSLGQVDPELVVLVGDISHGILKPYSAACPGRYYNVGICEPTIVSMAAGLAKMGFFPVAHTIAPFLLERSFEQIKLDFCYHKLPGNLVTVGGVFDYSNLGCTHHCYDDFALIKSLPNTQMVYPSTCQEFDHLFRQAYKNEFLTVYRIPGTTHEQEFRANELRLGEGIMARKGSDLTIVVTGPQLQSAQDACDGLKGLGWDPEVLYIHTVRPLDTALIHASVSRTRRVLVVEEHMQSGGLGDDVLRAISDLPNAQYSSLSIPDRFVTGYGSYEHHCSAIGLSREGIIARVERDFSK